jgi:hypothetical protein
VRRLSLGLMLLLVALEGVCADYGFRVLSAELVRVDDSYLLNAEMDCRFSDTAIEALKNGVPLTLVVRFTLQRRRDYWLDETLLRESRGVLIRYYPLSRSFQVTWETSGAPQKFASLSALLENLGVIRGWPMLAADRLAPGREYWASLSVDLDIEALPLPLRPAAYLSPEWYLGSSRFRWRVAG